MDHFGLAATETTRKKEGAVQYPTAHPSPSLPEDFLYGLHLPLTSSRLHGAETKYVLTEAGAKLRERSMGIRRGEVSIIDLFQPGRIMLGGFSLRVHGRR